MPKHRASPKRPKLTRAQFVALAIGRYRTKLQKLNVKDPADVVATQLFKAAQAGFAQLMLGRQSAHTPGWYDACLKAHSRGAATLN